MDPLACMLHLTRTQGLQCHMPSISMNAGLQYNHRSWLLYELQLLPFGLR